MRRFSCSTQICNSGGVGVLAVNYSDIQGGWGGGADFDQLGDVSVTDLVLMGRHCPS